MELPDTNGKPVKMPPIFSPLAGTRLFQEVREKRGLAYSIHAFHWAYAETGLFGFYAGCAGRDAGELMAASLDCLAEAADRLGADEVERAKAQMKVATLTALELPAPARSNSRDRCSVTVAC